MANEWEEDNRRVREEPEGKENREEAFEKDGRQRESCRLAGECTGRDWLERLPSTRNRAIKQQRSQ